MRVLVPLLLVLVPFASAGSAEAPELTDELGDCAVPYGNAYLDVVAAWVDGETETTFNVHLQLASFESGIAEGAGYSVQFTHQGLSWGIVAVRSTVIADGWEFSTGRATADLAEGLEEAPGSFDEATSTITVTFPKGLFEHGDGGDTTLRDFVAMSADLRPAYPFFLGEEAGLDGNGRWIVCDEAVGALDYAFTSGRHSNQHAAHGAGAPPMEHVPAAAVEPAPPAEAPTKETPLPAALALLALALALVARAKR